ncbi:hypothetical protein [Rhodococcus sp. T7]|uniref:hypothetical protein n=1 Tax=Rhodococcus sp. T7 TaxID=627444 RepID=UPI001917882B|nr:hypothetical protein [Rhodococcus sp. T7]
MTAHVGGTAVTATGDSGIAAADTPLVITPAPDLAPGSASSLSSTQGGVSIALGDDLQPKTPLTLTFEIPPGDTTFDGLGADIDPVLVAISKSNPDISELLPASWDPDARTLTATTTHLSDFYPGKIDLSGLREKISDNVAGFLSTKVDAPSCYGKVVTIGAVTYETTAPNEQVVWPCLSERNGNLVLSLHSNSSLGWIVRSVPAPVERHELTDLTASAVANTAVYASLLGSDVDDGTLLLPLGTSELTFNPQDVPRKVDMRVQAAMTLVDIGMHGASMLWGGNEWLEAANPFTAEDLAGCADTNFALSAVAGASDTQVGEMSRTLLDCTTALGGGVVESSALGLSESGREMIGTKLQGLASLPKSASLLSSAVTGLGGEFTGKNSASVVIRARGGDAVDVSAVPDEVFDIERFEMDNKLTEPVFVGRKVGPYQYKLNDEGHADITYKWTAVTGDDREINTEFCQVVVSIDGPQQFFDDVKTAQCSGGYSSSFGGIFKFRADHPGEYTIKITDAVTGLTAQTTFTVER